MFLDGLRQNREGRYGNCKLDYVLNGIISNALDCSILSLQFVSKDGLGAIDGTMIFNIGFNLYHQVPLQCVMAVT